jgi:tyrosine-protein kinase Etk/Wzc
MTEIQQHQPVYADDEVNLLDCWRAIWGHRKLIGAICAAIVLLTALYSFSLPKIYKSTATILPIQRGRASTADSNVASLLGITTTSDQQNTILNILNSRLIREKITDQFNLRGYYTYNPVHSMSAVKSLNNATKISPSREGVISIEVSDKDPEMAANIANAYIEHLNQLNAEFGAGTASNQRRFIAGQLIKTEEKLKSAEDALKEFQEKHHAVSLPDQASGAMTAAASLRNEITTAEVQLQVMQNFARDSHPEVISLRRKIQELKHQLAKTQYSAGRDLPQETGNPTYTRKEIYLPVAEVPQIGLELARLAREVKVQETVYTMLTQELERAKIEEVKDLPVVQPLDKAVPATSHYKPKILFNILVSGVASLFLSIFIAFSLDFIHKQRMVSSKGKVEVESGKLEL